MTPGEKAITRALSAAGFTAPDIEYARPRGYVEMGGPDGGWFVTARDTAGAKRHFSALTVTAVLHRIQTEAGT